MIFPYWYSENHISSSALPVFQEVMNMLLSHDLDLLELIHAMRKRQIIKQEEAAERRRETLSFRRRYYGR